MFKATCGIVAGVGLLYTSGVYSSEGGRYPISDDKIVSLSTGIHSGHVTYQIGGYINDFTNQGYLHFPLSELEFPLDVNTANFQFSSRLVNGGRFKMEYITNQNSSAGKMKDSDWLTPGSLDIYSESRSELDMDEVRVQYDRYLGYSSDSFWQMSKKTYLGVGYSKKNYDFNVYDLVQRNRSGSDWVYSSVPGLVLVYENSIEVIYFSLESEWKFENGGFFMSLIASPFVKVSDYDHHVLRNKVMHGSSEGEMLAFSVGTELFILPDASLLIAYSRETVESSGVQHQRNDDGTEALINLKHFLESNHVKVGFKFKL